MKINKFVAVMAFSTLGFLVGTTNPTFASTPANGPLEIGHMDNTVCFGDDGLLIGLSSYKDHPELFRLVYKKRDLITQVDLFSYSTNGSLQEVRDKSTHFVSADKKVTLDAVGLGKYIDGEFRFFGQRIPVTCLFQDQDGDNSLETPRVSVGN